MPHEPLKLDPASAEQWAQLPQNPPSRRALPPLMHGTRALERALWGWMLLTLVIIMLALLFGRGL